VEKDPEWQYNTQEERDVAKSTHGKVWMWPTEKEWASRTVRPSLYITADVKKGEKLIFQGGHTNKGNFDSIRPNDGLGIEYTDIVDGAIATRDIQMGEPLQWDHVIKK
jgi:N-acetylneuraminate synthase